MEFHLIRTFLGISERRQAMPLIWLDFFTLTVQTRKLSSSGFSQCSVLTLTKAAFTMGRAFGSLAVTWAAQRNERFSRKTGSRFSISTVFAGSTQKSSSVEVIRL